MIRHDAKERPTPSPTAPVPATPDSDHPPALSTRRRIAGLLRLLPRHSRLVVLSGGFTAVVANILLMAAVFVFPFLRYSLYEATLTGAILGGLAAPAADLVEGHPKKTLALAAISFALGSIAVHATHHLDWLLAMPTAVFLILSAAFALSLPVAAVTLARGWTSASFWKHLGANSAIHVALLAAFVTVLRLTGYSVAPSFLAGLVNTLPAFLVGFGLVILPLTFCGAESVRDLIEEADKGDGKA